MSNLFASFRRLIPNPPLQAGTVESIADGVAIILLPDGGRLQARGDATVGEAVFVRDGAIEGTAPDLPAEDIEV